MMNPLEAAIASVRHHLQLTALPVGPGLDAEEELRRRPRGGDGGGTEGGKRRRARGAAPGRLIAFRPLVLGAGAAVANSGLGLAAKARLAAGAQPAVVKVASFAGGPARVKSLLDYLSRQGELAVEDETGAQIDGREGVLGLGRRWSDRFDGRAESRDVVRIELTAPGASLSTADEWVRVVSGDRPFAYSGTESEGRLRVDLVVGVRSPADGSRLPLRGRAFAEHFKDGAGEGARPELAAWAHAEAGAVRLLHKLSEDAGQQEIIEREGRALATDADVREAAKAWAETMRPRSPRDTMHLVVSARAGTDRETFKASVRDYLSVAFPGHRYAFALHQDRPHLHAHAVITMRAADGSRLHPNITDFHAWRGMFAEAARGHGLAFTATRRHDRAAAPAYKLKHVRAVERGDALEATRRRVVVKKADAVVAPRTEQGRAAASAAAREWRQIAGELPKNEVQIASHMRDRVNWGQALGENGSADHALKQMAAGLVNEVGMARMTDTEAKRGLEAIRETAAGVSSRFVDQDARREFDRATGDLVRLVEDRISVQRTAANAETKPSDTTTSGTAGGGTSTPARGEGGPSAHPETADRSSENARETDEADRGRGQVRAPGERVTDAGRATSQSSPQPTTKATMATPAETSEERLRERIERERAQGRDLER